MITKASLLKPITSIALVLMLMLGITLPAFGAPAGPLEGDETNPAETKVTKLLVMPAGTTTPNASFTFEFAPVSVDDSTDAAALATMPVVTDKIVNYDATAVGTTSNGIKTVPVETDSIFANVVWPHAGVYVYQVTEKKDTYTIANSFLEDMTYSKGAYDITAYVQEKADKSGYYVFAIAATIVINDASNTGQQPGVKVNPTPNGGPGSISGTYSQIAFTNEYTKNNGGTNPVKDSVLRVGHEVSGAFADKTKPFSYDVTVTNPSTVTNNAKTYKAYVMDENDQVVANISGIVNASYIKNDPTYGNYIEFTTGAPLSLKLTHGQYLSFVDLPVGASFAAKVSGETDYTPRYALTLDGILVTQSLGIEANDLGFAPQLIGEAANIADFVNVYKTVTPTGISVDTLPYLVLIALAVCAMVGYVATKSRKSTQIDA